mgnify:CR=1 FL=1
MSNRHDNEKDAFVLIILATLAMLAGTIIAEHLFPY